MAEERKHTPVDFWPVLEFRPLPDAFGRRSGEMLRYADGKWLPDDGEYDLAFVIPSFCLMIELPYQRNIVLKGLTTHWRANVLAHPNGNPWHYRLRDGATEGGGDWGRDRHPNEIAGRSGMGKACAIGGGCSNGRHVEFSPGDPHFAAGSVRGRDSKRTVILPEPICMYCGDEWRAAIKRATERKE